MGVQTADIAGPAARSAAVEASISLFGGVDIRLGGVVPNLKSRKAQALLGYLLMSPGASEPRERLSGLFWSESSEEKARASLRQTIHAARECLGAAGWHGLDAGRDGIGLAKHELRSDLQRVLDAMDEGRLDPLLLDRKRLSESLFQGYEDLDPSFRIWVLVQRQALGERLQRRLEDLLAGRHPARSALRDVAAALINLDPTHEEACRFLMRAYAEQGDTASALKLYKRLWDLLDEDYGTEPSEATQELLVAIKNGEIRPGSTGRSAEEAPAAPVEEGGTTFLVVGEFDSRGVDEDHSHLGQALRHELIARLVRFRDWTVLEGREIEGIDRLRELRGLCFSIDTTLRQVGSALSLIITVKEQPTARYVWGETFALRLDNWFEIQRTVVRRIAMALNLSLSTERLMSIARRPSISVGTYDRWLRGQQHVLAWQADRWSEAGEIFRSIVAEAPSFSAAYSGLAQLLNVEHLTFPGRVRSIDRNDEALEMAKLAVESDPFDSRAHLAYAWAQAMGGQFDQAEMSYGLALKLNDTDPWTLSSGALGMAFCGQTEAALELADQALSLHLDPSPSHWGYQATIRFLCEDYAGCVSAAEKARDVISNIPAWHAAALSHLGHADASRRAGHFLSMIRRRWHGDAEADDERVVGWLLHCFPIRREADWARLRDGLRAAGLPAGSLDYQAHWPIV